VILPDVNVLIFAFREDMPQHAVCRPWLTDVVSSDARFGLSLLVLSAVVRITTNPRIYKIPSALDEAFGFCEDMLAQPHCQIVDPGERHWEIFKRLCLETETRGARVTDAWFAALAIEWGCEWITLDRDYARFPGLKWRVPEAPRHSAE
jgi:toxin-antitoxin system PIN domain toxin